MRHFLLSLILVPSFMLPLGSSEAPTWPQQHTDLADPAVTFGVLENGLRYAVRANAEPPGEVSMRMLVQAGSWQETLETRGLAHYLEHMAFNGTKSYPGGSVIEVLQDLGAAFGSHTNAHTGFDETVYKLDLPKVDDVTLGTGLQVLAEWARGLTLDPEEVEQERGVILAELRDRDGPGLRIARDLYAAAMAGWATAERFPIGYAETIEAVQAADLKKYYDRWYRPERMVLSVVGDFDPALVVPLIEQHFAGLEGVGEHPQWDAGALIAASEPQIVVRHDPESGGTRVRAWALSQRDTLPAGEERWRRRIARSLVGSILNRRFAALAEADNDPPLLSGGVWIGDYVDLHHGDASVQAKPGRELDALVVLEQEMRRFLEFGPTAAEIATAKESYRANLDAAVERAGARKHRGLAGALYQSGKRDRIFMSPEQQRTTMVPLLDAIEPAELMAVYSRALDAKRLVVAVTGRADLGEEGATQVATTWAQAQSEAVSAPAETERVAWAYGQRPAAPQEISRSELPFGIQATTYPNNVQALLLPRSEEPGVVVMSVTIELPVKPESPGALQWVERVGLQAGLGQHSAAEMREILAAQTIQLSGPSVGARSVSFQLSCRGTEMERALQLIRAYLTDVAWPESIYEQARTAWLEGLSGSIHELDWHLDYHLNQLTNSAYPQLRAATIPEVQALDLPSVQARYLDVIANGALEMALVGDFDLTEAQQLVDSYFGSLPERTPVRVVPDQSAPGALVAVAPLPQAEVVVPVDAVVARSLVRLVWPTDDMADIGRTRRLSLLAGVIDEYLREEVRESLGDAYSPWAGHRNSDTFDHHGQLMINVGVSPERSDDVREVIGAFLQRIMTEGVDPEKFERVHKPMLAGLPAYRRGNNYWLRSVMSRAASRPERLAWAKQMEDDFAAVTIEEINALAQEYLSWPPPLVVIATSAGDQSVSTEAEPVAE